MVQKRIPTQLIFSSILLIAIQLWISVCIPFIHTKQVQHVVINGELNNAQSEEPTTSNEEKNQTSSSTSDYISEIHKTDEFFKIINSNYSFLKSSWILNFENELISPPPEVFI